jgi:hypothetical protein
LSGQSNSGWRAATAGLIYFAVVFAVGFALGIVRTLVAPAIGQLGGVAVELPLMLSAAWVVSNQLRQRVRVRGLRGAVIMGAVALVVLLPLEAGFAIVVFGRTVKEQLSSYCEPAQALGLAGQIVFATIPALQVAFRRG